MYTPHPVFLDPQGITKIWRYFDFTKFVSLLERRALFFSRADRFRDPFEGSWTRLDVKFREQEKIKELKSKNHEINDEEIKNALKQDSLFYKNIKRASLISSWHYNESESAAMWRLFLKSDEGIAIQSTTERFKACFNAYPEPVYIGKVNYINYDTDKFYYPFNVPFVTLLHKRSAFEHEREYRAIISLDQAFNWDEEETPLGKYVPVDVDTLIENIYVSPGTPTWYSDLILSLVGKYGLKKQVVPSVLNKKPIF
jgi:hypothetical protein